MSCVAIFVDAGYLFAQGATALSGSNKPRAQLKLNETAALAELVTVATAKSGSSRLLRVYWYDGSFNSSKLTLEHATLAHTDYIKLRLGQMNSQGQQKGVDSLIITDLIELGRNRAITDALLLSGDEDVRVGVQIAQTLGVRVHLLGIAPSRGSQSVLLLQEADTTTEWDKATVAKFLSVQPTLVAAIPATLPPKTAMPATPSTSAQPHLGTGESERLELVATKLFATLDSKDVADLRAYFSKERTLPSEIDGNWLRGDQKLAAT
jgi:uncharacterized LabA/DUF88 family protein